MGRCWDLKQNNRVLSLKSLVSGGTGFVFFKKYSSTHPCRRDTALSLNYINLKTRVCGTSKQPGNKKTPFIEINQPILMPEMVLELENKKGSRLKISFKGRIDFDPMDLAKTFYQKNL